MTARQFRDENGRVCSRCKQYKSWDSFNKNKSDPDGHRPNCKQCQKEAEVKYKRDPKKARAAMDRYRLKNLERYRAYQREYKRKKAREAKQQDN